MSCEYEVVVLGMMVVGGIVDVFIGRYVIKCMYMVVCEMGKLVVIYFCVIEKFCVYMYLCLKFEIGCMY